MKNLLLISVGMMLCLSMHVQCSCDQGETNYTIIVSCFKNVSVEERVQERIRIVPDCSGWDRAWSWITNKCNTKYRTVTKVVQKIKVVKSHCDSVRCCPGYIMTLNDTFCAPGCPNGTYGENCTETCTCPDNAYSHCDKNTGNCTCLSGKTGVNCTGSCDEGYYGDDCQHECVCQNNSTCDTETGHCNCTELGWTGTHCDQGCNDTFGFNCSRNCTCNENQTCDPVNGNCTCKPGQTGDNCSDECLEGLFGVDCEYKCTCNNNSTELCDKVTGTCHCKPGYIGHDCSELCPMGYYGNHCSQNCTCVGTPYCDHRNGTCICIGKSGENCSNDCGSAHYGLDCLSICNCSGGKFNGSCDSVTGDCHCIPGWEGENCMTEEGNTNGLTDVQKDKNVDENDVMTTNLMIGLITGGCAFLIIIIIISGFVVQRRRKRKCFTRPEGKQFDNAMYSKAQETVVLNETKQQTGNETEENITKNKLHENDKFKGIQDDLVDKRNTISDTRSKSEEKIPDYRNEMKLGETEIPDSTEYEVAKDNAADHVHENANSHQAVYELPKLDDVEDVALVNADDNSDHYSDVDSIKEEETMQKRYSVVECVDEFPEDQNYSDEEQYDSLTHNMKEKVNKLPTYSSFEQVRKESLDNSSESTDEPYDKVILTGQTNKKTLIRHDYDKFAILNKTTDVSSNEKTDNLESNAVSKTKNSIPVSAQSKGIRSLNVNDDNTDYNSLDNTGKLCITNISNNVYHTTGNSNIKATVSGDTALTSLVEAKARSENSEESDSEYNTLDHSGKSFRALNKPENIYHSREQLSKANTDKDSITETKDGSEIAPKTKLLVKQNSVSDEQLVAEESEYNTLDHTGKSFRAQKMPENIYHSGEHLAKADTDNRLMSQNEDSSESTAKIKSSVLQRLDSNDNPIVEDSDYNTLDHTGKSFHAVNVSENVYHSNRVDPSKTAKKLKALEICDPKNDIAEDDSYSFCEIDEGDIVEKDIADDEKFIYEVPDVSDNDLETSEANNKNETTKAKAKAKSKQRQIDDYEAFELPFGNFVQS